MRLIAIMVWKEFSHIKADPIMIRLIIFPVLLQIFILGYALTTEVKHTPIAVLDASMTPQSRELVASVKNSYLFRFTGMISTADQARELLDKGSVKIVLSIPRDFSSSLHKPDGASLQILVDGQDANSSKVATGYLNAIISSWTFTKLTGRLEKQGVSVESMIPVKTFTKILFNPLLQSSWYMIPGLVVILVTMITAILTAFSIVKEKERGTFEQLLVTPIKPIQVIFGKIFPFVILGIFEILAFLVLATWWFEIPFRGSVFVLLTFGLIYMTSSLGLGIFASTIARTSQQVLFIIFFIMVFFMLLSGFFLPIENMPDWVQKITYINPVRYFMFIVREIFLKGAGFAELWRESLYMFSIGALFFGLSLLFFTKKTA